MQNKSNLANKKLLEQFGFKYKGTGVHTSRTMMYEDLNLLLSYVNNPDAEKASYIEAIINGNCLRKRSVINRNISAKRLAELYGLDPSLVVFRALRFFWGRDENGRPLLALLCAISRDPLLCESIPFIFNHNYEEAIDRLKLEDFLKERSFDYYSNSSLKSITQNINSTWTKSGHLKGRVKKIRTKATATPAAVAYALLLSYLTGARGEYLFNTQFTRVLDCSYSELLDLAEEASRRGWIVLKRIGEVIEAQFPSLLTKEELEWVYEQNR
ncbi:MAG: hypothetical protein SVV67_05460 [Bacillota bacterium]|nr:hypothetical protein [Bacillota bacterium]